jgi:hypothetical protein
MPRPLRRGEPVQLRVERRILWVGSAAIPLRNVSWVAVDRQRFPWGKAAVYFLLLLIASLLFSARLDSLNGGDSSVPGVPIVFILIVVCVVLLSSRKPLLLIEMNSGSSAVLTLPSMEELRAIGGQIVYACDHPDYEFFAVLKQHNTTNNFGPVVNMNGGRGNTGFRL